LTDSRTDTAPADTRPAARGRAKPATIVDVAKAAQVSIKTVSRVLNREPNVSAATREQVLAAAARLHYTPNVSARSLAGVRSYLIALLYDNPNAAYIADLQLGALGECRRGGYHLIVEPFDATSPDVASAVGDMAAKLRTDGVILTPPLCDNPALLDALDATGTRYVRISANTDPDRSPLVMMDEKAAAREMTRRLIALGHRDIAFVKGHPNHGGSHRRLEGFLEAMAEAGLEARPDFIVEGLYSFLSGVEAGVRLLERNERPSAIFAANDDMALGVMSVANRLGIPLPSGLSVAGFDDTPTARVVWPQLTTVRQPVAEMAATAAGLLIQGASEENETRRILNFEIIERDSTAPGPFLNEG
jgi:LacI family transcriptional regulator